MDRKKHFLTLLDHSEKEIRELIALARDFRAREVVCADKTLCGKTLAMLFEKSSTRTRVSFEVAMTQLGGHAIFLDLKNTQLGRGETIEDTARTLSRYCDVVMARLYKQETIEALAAASSIPVINGLTELFHPCQTLADMQTVFEKKGDVKGLKVAFFGDCGFNMFHSTMIGFSKLGADVVGACPAKKEFQPNPAVFEKAKAQARGKISVEHDAAKAAKDADVVITDAWVSMGQEETAAQRLKDLAPYQVNAALLKRAKRDCIFLHCLPAHRGQEVTAEVIDGAHSVVWDEAENRLHAQKAVLLKLVK